MKSHVVHTPGHPDIAYGPSAQGHTVPAFAVVMVPMTPRRPALADILVHEPGELGPQFYARALRVAFEHSILSDEQPERLCVWFTNALPPESWRKRWHEVELLTWRLWQPLTPASVCTSSLRRLKDLL